LSKTFSQLRLHGSVQAKVEHVEGFWLWCRPGTHINHIAAAFAQVPDRSELVRRLQFSSDGGPLSQDHKAQLAKASKAHKEVAEYLHLGQPSSDLKRAVLSRRRELLMHPKNGEAPVGHDDRFSTWWRLWIPEPTVDLIECFLRSVLEPLGQRVHFIDDWEYHQSEGEVHCGTNALRRPPSTKWWEHYDPSLNLRYSV
jgi:hypothetical protein